MTPPAPAVLAVLTFGLPLLAWGALAAVIPVLIHLVLRQRPRREMLPTLRFLLRAHQASSRAHRLKHLILLACRMTAIVLVVALLMKTGCAPAGARSSGSTAPVNGPVSAVVAIDDSASMQYRYRGRTRLEDARAWARDLLTDVERFPPGSEMTVMAGAMDPARPAGWSRDPNAMARLVSDIQPGWHDRPVASLLRQAYALLSTAAHPRREVYLFTDLTESSWQEPPPEPPKELAGVFILDVGRNENRNLALGRPEVPANLLSANQPATVQIRVQSGETATPGTVTLSIDGRPRDRRAVEPARTAGEGTPNGAPSASEGLTPRSETILSFSIPPLPEGLHELLLELEPDDALSFDNRRFACLAVGQVPGVIIAGEEAGGSVATLVSAMIAPPALPREEQRFSIQRITGPALSMARLERPLVVILADPTNLTPGGWQSLERYLSAGGTILLIPGPNTTPETYAGQDRLLPAEIRGTIAATEPITVAAADLSHPYLKPFTDSGLDSINDRLVFRHLQLGPPRPGATVITPFSDRSPAILESRIGPGRVIQLAFSPDRDWSQFGTQAGPFIVLLHCLLESLSPRPDNVDSLIAGHPAVHRWPVPSPDYMIQGPEGPAMPLSISEAASPLPTDRPGHYRVFAGHPTTQPALLYSVNVAEAESELDRITDETVRSHFTSGLVLIAHDPAGLPSRRAASGGAVSWTVPLALALLALLWAESFFANRFYGKRSSGIAEAPKPSDAVDKQIT